MSCPEGGVFQACASSCGPVTCANFTAANRAVPGGTPSNSVPVQLDGTLHDAADNWKRKAGNTAASSSAASCNVPCRPSCVCPEGTVLHERKCINPYWCT